MRVSIKRKGPVFAPLGDSALLVTLGTRADLEVLHRARTLARSLNALQIAGTEEAVPAYGSVAVFYEAARVAPGKGSPYERLCSLIEPLCPREPSAAGRRLRRKPSAGKKIEVPVCYGGEFGLDLDAVASHSGLSVDQVIALHSGGTYLVQAIGFAPGFPYLTGLPEKLHMPRRATPRDSVPAGSVGIGGTQTGVYPISTPGGWNLIGRTPLSLFRIEESPPALLQTGDVVSFKPITAEAFAAWK
jgi:inhibitor of KinA